VECARIEDETLDYNRPVPPASAQDILDRAEQAATAGDFESAFELLRSAAAVQEEELGPLHPDLANTLNNLAVVAEKTGHPSEAETFYRRAVAIASASLPSEHPMVVASRQNLEDFCRARGLPIDAPAISTPTRDAAVGSGVSAAGPPATVAGAPAVERPVGTSIDTVTAPPPPVASRPVTDAPATMASRPSPPAPTSGIGSHRVAWVVIAVVVLLAAVLLVLRSRSSRDTTTPASAAAVPPPPAARPAEPAPIEPTEPPKAAPRRDDRKVATDKTPATPGGVTLAAAELCRNFSTSGRNWRCDPLGNSTKPGSIVLYTRVRSPRDGAVVHRWYRGNALRQSVRLAIRASATEGYRTYSRQTVAAGDWRVEVRSADGSLLHEQRFAVR
jgi:hypothetical protein